MESLKDGHSPFPTPVTSDERNMKVRSIEKVDSREEEKGKEEEKKCLLVFEKTIDLSDLVYLGTMVCVCAWKHECYRRERESQYACTSEHWYAVWVYVVIVTCHSEILLNPVNWV